jgi:hypothetical protein
MKSFPHSSYRSEDKSVAIRDPEIKVARKSRERATPSCDGANGKRYKEEVVLIAMVLTNIPEVWDIRLNRQEWKQRMF